MKQEKSYIFAFVKRKTNKMVNYLNTIFQIQNKSLNLIHILTISICSNILNLSEISRIYYFI